VTSISAIVSASEAHGVTMLQPPAEYPWGVRAVLRDPDGRPVEVFEPR
jgi:predicted enzyme related to lactoylglutathione lyase